MQTSKPAGTLMTRLLLAVMLALGVSACAVLQDANPTETARTFAFQVPVGPAAGSGADGPILLVAMPEARAGFDSRRMVYTERPYELQFFARNEWADTPARMLLPALVEHLDASRHFTSVVTEPSAVITDLRLNTLILDLRQDFRNRPSEARVSLRVQITDQRSNAILATETFTAAVTSPSDDPYGGVQAINRALADLLGRVVDFCVATLRSRGK